MSIIRKLIYHPETSILIYLIDKGVVSYLDFHRFTSGRGATHRAVKNLLSEKLIVKIEYGKYKISDLGIDVTGHILKIRELIS